MIHLPPITGAGLQQALRATALAALLALAGCAAQQQHSEGLKLLAEGQPEPGLNALRKASELEPDNARYRIDFLAQRQTLTQRRLDEADRLLAQNRLDPAAAAYRGALALSAGNDLAERGLAQVEARKRAEQTLRQAEKKAAEGQWESAAELLRKLLRDQPGQAEALKLQTELAERAEAQRLAKAEQLGLQGAFKRPVTLQFRNAALPLVFEAIARATNVNIVLDRDVRTDLRSTIFVKDASVEDAVDMLLMQNQLEKRVLNSNSMIIYPSTSAKQKDYAEMHVRNFQLSNIDAAHMANLIKTMVKTKDIVADARSNTLVMRDSAEAIAIAERMVAAADQPDAEVMLEVEVLELTNGRSMNLGTEWPMAISLSVPTVGTGPNNAVDLSDLKGLRRGQLLVNALSAKLNLKLEDSDTNILASPRIRSRNKEKAQILVGDKLPVITNLLTPQTSGTNNVLTGSIQYVDVGIKLEVEPQVHGDGDVSIKLKLEVSSVTNQLTTQSGLAYQIGTRSTQTTLRLHDGETQIMAGLINNQDRNTASKVPGIGQLPVLGRLFRNDATERLKTEILLSITPHIIRPLASLSADQATVFTGTDAMVRARPMRLDPIETLKLGPATPATPAAAPGRSPVLSAPPAPAALPPASPAPEAAPAAGQAAPPAAPAGPSAGSTMPGINAPTARPMPGRTPMTEAGGSAPAGAKTP